MMVSHKSALPHCQASNWVWKWEWLHDTHSDARWGHVHPGKGVIWLTGRWTGLHMLRKVWLPSCDCKVATHLSHFIPLRDFLILEVAAGPRFITSFGTISCWQVSQALPIPRSKCFRISFSGTTSLSRELLLSVLHASLFLKSSWILKQTSLPS